MLAILHHHVGSSTDRKKGSYQKVAQGICTVHECWSRFTGGLLQCSSCPYFRGGHNNYSSRSSCCQYPDGRQDDPIHALIMIAIMA